MRVYNTLGGQKEELHTLEPRKVNMYVCGPTTYNYIHLGNARPLVVFDTVRRYLAYRGYQVTYVQNFTDVDDKIINRAQEEGEDPLTLAERYIDEYYTDADALNIQRADVHPRVSQHMEEIIAAVEILIQKGFAYQVEGDVYYRVKAFGDYGKLSGRAIDEMLAGARVEVDERKESPMDFALWKAAKPGEPYWESPWGQGRPGWHIECSVMSAKYLGETFDIHGGGSDLIFPHHENEIAQAEAITGKPFVRYWMHNGFITVNNEKMSKSLGNFFILRDILKKYPADAVRFYLISTHYRSPLDFDDGKLEEARKALNRLKTTLMLADEYIADNDMAVATPDARGIEFLQRFQDLCGQFIEAMDDDFNTAKATGILFEMSHLMNAFVAASSRGSDEDLVAVRQARMIFFRLGDIFGLFSTSQVQGELMTDKALEILAALRSAARQEKDFGLADQIRDMLGEMDIRIEDGAAGTSIRYDSPPALDQVVNQLINLRTDFKVRRAFDKADSIRDRLQDAGIILEDTREGVRWKIVEA